jgi:phospholipid/cholesterol/gamma-HCH transport system substrate-binding protein
MGVQPRSIEVKVGLLILVAIGLLAAFVLVMGQVSFQPKYRLLVDFDNPGGVTAGSSVRIAGIKVGRVEAVEYRGGAVNEATHQREPTVRLEITVEKRYQNAVRKGSTFYVTTQGVLGEQFLQIDPGAADQAVLPEGAIVRGLDPPRLDMLLAESFELLHTSVTALRENKKELGEMFSGLKDTLKGTGEFFRRNQDRLDRIAENTEQLTRDADGLIQATRSRYVDGAQISRIMDRLDRTTELVTRDAEPILKDARETLANAARVSKAVGSPEQEKKLRAAVTDLAEIASRAKATAADAQAVVAKIRHGEGSLGALLMDEQIYDDIQELARDLKHNPWKFFWRE